jgi:energy-converting hydrogenase B subunit D
MIGVLQLLLLVLLAATGMAVVLTREPRLQVVTVSFYGLILSILFFVYQAPDVALSQITVGAVALPLLILLALTKIRRNELRREQAREAAK